MNLVRMCKTKTLFVEKQKGCLQVWLSKLLLGGYRAFLTFLRLDSHPRNIPPEVQSASLVPASRGLPGFSLNSMPSFSPLHLLPYPTLTTARERVG